MFIYEVFLGEEYIIVVILWEKILREKNRQLLSYENEELARA